MVDDHGSGNIVGAKPGPLGLEAKIHVFGIHEIVSAEHANCLEHRTLHHEASAGYCFYLAGPVAPYGQRLLSPYTCLRKTGAQQVGVQELVQDRGKGADAGVLNGSIAVEKLGADDRRLGHVRQMVVQTIARGADNLGIRIQKQEDATTRGTECCVVGVGESDISVQLKE